MMEIGFLSTIIASLAIRTTGKMKTANDGAGTRVRGLAPKEAIGIAGPEL